MSRAVRKLPEPAPASRRPGRRAILTGLAFAAAATWFATAPAFPLLPARPVPPREVVRNPDNALPAVSIYEGPVRFPPGDPANWRRRLMNASFQREPVPASMRPVVAGNATALAEVRASARLPRFRMTGLYGDEPLDYLVEGCYDLGRLAVVAFRVGGPDPGRLVDALGMARRAMWAPQEAAIASEIGAGIAESAYDAERAERARLLALPEPALRALLRDLNALDPIEIPLDRLLGGHRDHALLPAGMETGEDRFEEDKQWLVRPLIGYLREHTGRIADERVARLAERRFAAERAVQARYPAVGAFTAMLHPVAALARLTAAEMPVDAWAHRVLCAEARFDALRTGLALELYRRAHGGWPITLDALVPAYLPAVPKDPYYLQRPLGWDGYTLYSIGPDGFDDRRKRGRTAGAWPPPFDRRGDFLLWPDVGFAAAR